MAITAGVAGISSGRQQRVYGFVDVAYTDLVSGVDYALFWLPAGATDIKATVFPITAFNSATTDVLDLGNDTTENAYKNDGNLAALTSFDAAGFPVVVSQGFWVSGRWVGAGAAPSAGLFRVVFSYIQEDRNQFDHGPSKWPHD